MAWFNFLWRSRSSANSSNSLDTETGPAGTVNIPPTRPHLATGRTIAPSSADTSAGLRAYVQAQNTLARINGAASFALLVWTGLLFGFLYAYWLLPDGSPLILTCVVLAYLSMVSFSLPLFLVYQAPFEGALLDNIFTAGLWAVGRGINFKFPWLRKTKERVVSLEVITYSFEETFLSGDNVRLHIKAIIQLMPLLSHLQKFWEIENDAIVSGAIASVKKCMTEVISKYDADDIRQKPGQVEWETVDKYMESGSIHLSFEAMYGTGLYDLEVSDIDRSQTLAKEYEEIALAGVLVEAAQN